MSLKTLGRRAAVGLVASAVSILTYAVVAQAAQTITTPNAATFTYNLAAGANSAAIPVPSNVPVFVMGTQNEPGVRGVGHVSMLSIPGAGGFLEWVGLSSPSNAAVEQGFSGTAGTHIVWIDWQHLVDLQVNTIGATNTMRVRNGAGGVRSGRVTLMW